MKEVLLFLMMTTSTKLYCQQSQNPKKRVIESVSANVPVNVDGILSEEVWSRAPIASQFTQIEPSPGAPANFLTEVRSAYDETYLYFAITAYDSVKARRYRAPDMKRDFSFQNHDLVGIAIDGFNDGRNSMTFFVNAYGAQRDYLSFDDTYFDVDWNGLWHVKTTRTDSLWIAEFAIPWKTLRYKLDTQTQPQFGINFQRVRRKSNERSAWSPYPRGVGFNRMEYVGIITGFAPPKPTTNVQVNPYGLLSNYSNSDTKIRMGGEVKWAVNPNLVIDATVNTDFAQADVDQKVNNITRFSVLFPEKRQFFLENASLFGAGISGEEGSQNGSISLIPFFSRRIGLDNSNRPIPITYGSRLVYRSIKRSYGAMVMQQQENDLNPQTYHMIARYSENVGKYSRIGIIGTSRTETATDSTATQHDYTTAVDALVRVNASNWLTGMFGLTRADNPLSRAGIAGYLKYEFINARVNAWLTSTLVDKNFNPKSGFISRTNVYAIIPGIQLNLRKSWLPYKKKLRDFIPSVSGEFYFEESTKLRLEQKIKVTPLAYNFIRGGQISFSYLYNYQNIINEFQPLGIPIQYGEYQFNRAQVSLSSDGSKHLSYSLSYDWGSYFNGSLINFNAALVFAPDPHFSISTMLNQNSFKAVGIEKIDQSVNLLTINSRIAASPRLQLNLNYQRNTNDSTAIYNARLSWEYLPLSFVYLVYNSQVSTSQEINSEQNVILKVSLLRQF
jgi:hypothetical protein